MKPRRTSADESFSRLLYAYLWPFWMFENANQGSLLERAAAYRHNRGRRAYLRGYMVKWGAIVTLLLGVLIAFGNSVQPDLLSDALSILLSLVGVLAVLAVVVLIEICVAYLLLTHWED